MHEQPYTAFTGPRKPMNNTLPPSDLFKLALKHADTADGFEFTFRNEGLVQFANEVTQACTALNERDRRSLEGGLEMALAQAALMIDRQHYAMQQAVSAWDAARSAEAHTINRGDIRSGLLDGLLSRRMEKLRSECKSRDAVEARDGDSDSCPPSP